MKEEIIQFIGLDDLNEEEKTVLKELSEEYYEKIKRSLKNMTSLAVHVKIYKNEGSRKKYSLHVRAIAPTDIIETDKEADWDLARTLHKSFKNIERQIEHKFKD